MFLFLWNYIINHKENEHANKKASHRKDIIRHRSGFGQNNTKYKTCHIMKMLICINQYPSNSWSSIHEKVK